jgi:hypothetical protein
LKKIEVVRIVASGTFSAARTPAADVGADNSKTYAILKSFSAPALTKLG